MRAVMEAWRHDLVSKGFPEEGTLRLRLGCRDRWGGRTGLFRLQGWHM